MPLKDAEKRRAYQKLYHQRYYQVNREQKVADNKAYAKTAAGQQSQLERAARYRQRHRDEIRKKNRIRMRSDSERAAQRRRQLKRLFGITVDQYAEMLAAQGGLCAICRQPETVPNRRSPDERFHRDGCSLSVDHDHATGAIRGLLCSGCNGGLGRFKDSVASLRLAAEYLESHAKRVDAPTRPEIGV